MSNKLVSDDIAESPVHRPQKSTSFKIASRYPRCSAEPEYIPRRPGALQLAAGQAVQPDRLYSMETVRREG
jgi:hypothetical protein